MHWMQNVSKSYIKYYLPARVSTFALNGIRSMSSFPKPIETKIHDKLRDTFMPEHLEIINESYMHNVPKGSETHFKVIVISKKFDGVPLIERHRKINDALLEELNGGVHALSIVAKTPEKWQESDKTIKASPNCKGGFGI